MKLKDIKKQLNKETDENTPDVLDNVKVSPINKLKKNEKSMTVFKKTMATLILVFLLAILVVLSIAIHGLVSQDDGKIDNFTFLSIRIYDGTDQNGLDSDDLKIYNLILDDNGKILLVYDQNTNEKLATPRNFEDITDIIDCESGSTIYIIGASDGPAYARQFARGVEDIIAKDSDFEDAKIVTHINDTLSKTTASESVALLPGFNANEHTDLGSINKVCALYLTLID